MRLPSLLAWLLALVTLADPIVSRACSMTPLGATAEIVRRAVDEVAADDDFLVTIERIEMDGLNPQVVTRDSEGLCRTVRFVTDITAECQVRFVSRVRSQAGSCAPGVE